MQLENLRDISMKDNNYLIKPLKLIALRERVEMMLQKSQAKKSWWRFLFKKWRRD